MQNVALIKDRTRHKQTFDQWPTRSRFFKCEIKHAITNEKMNKSEENQNLLFKIVRWTIDQTVCHKVNHKNKIDLRNQIFVINQQTFFIVNNYYWEYRQKLTFCRLQKCALIETNYAQKLSL